MGATRSSSAYTGAKYTAATPSTPITPTVQKPAFGRCRENRPAMAPTSVITTNMPVSRTSLSFVPNAVFANSVSGSGDRRITTSPTARNGEDAAEIRPATRWPNPSAAHTASTPIIAATGRERVVVGAVAATGGCSAVIGLGRLTEVAALVDPHPVHDDAPG